jgi:alkanesulfonate monooxygenase SsuD/methylene tetrahydromethanopterin reductase-like flavin-dependent oxidoreductase (luciferase family)
LGWNRITILTYYDRNPKDNSRSKDTIEYYTWLAKLAEKGKLTSIFFADTYAVHDTYEGSPDASFRGGHAAGQLDPTIMAASMCAVTKSLSVGMTGSTTYIPVRTVIYHVYQRL